MVMLFSPFLKSIGVQTEQLEIILLTKLKMDGRRNSALSHNAKKGKKVENMEWRTMAYFFFLGLFCLVILLRLKIMVSAIAVYLTIWIVMLALTLISDFTDVLIDVRDNYILLPRPINDRTLAVSRLIHVMLYLFRLVVSFSIPGLIYFAVQGGVLGFLVFGFQMFLSVILTIFLVNMVYLLILRVTTQQKFKEIINYFQIGFVMVIMTGYYILPRLIDLDQFEFLDVMETSWTYFLPSVWVASIWNLVMEADFSSTTILLAGIGVLTPFVAMYLVATVLSKNFSQKLMGLGQGSKAGNDDVPKKSTAKESSSLMDWCNEKVSKTIIEKAGFKLSWMITARSRDYKLKTYPLFGFIPAMFIYFALDGKGSLAERWADLVASDNYILLIYFCIYGAMVPIQNLRYSEKFKSSWIFYALPIEKPGLFLKGAVKSVITRFVVPIFMLTTVVTIAVWGIKSIDDIIIGLLNVLIITAFIGKMNLDVMPFSQSWTGQAKGSGFVKTMGIMIGLTLLGFIHWSLVDQPIAIMVWLVIAAGLVWFSFRRFDGIEWKDIKA